MLIASSDAVYFLGDTMDEDFKCPWCDANFPDGRELDTHARKHYLKETVS
jgi:hypothetical protein